MRNFDFRHRTPTLLLSVVLFAMVEVGCNSHPPVAKVEGVITLEGKSVVGGKVLFLPVAGGMQGIGKIEADGSFCLGTFGKQDGALVGEHHAMILNVVPETGSDKELIFKAAETQSLTVEADKTNHFEIELKSPDWQFVPKGRE